MRFQAKQLNRQQRLTATIFEVAVFFCFIIVSIDKNLLQMCDIIKNIKTNKNFFRKREKNSDFS